MKPQAFLLILPGADSACIVLAEGGRGADELHALLAEAGMGDCDVQEVPTPESTRGSAMAGQGPPRIHATATLALAAAFGACQGGYETPSPARGFVLPEIPVQPMSYEHLPGTSRPSTSACPWNRGKERRHSAKRRRGR